MVPIIKHYIRSISQCNEIKSAVEGVCIKEGSKTICIYRWQNSLKNHLKSKYEANKILSPWVGLRKWGRGDRATRKIF